MIQGFINKKRYRKNFSANVFNVITWKSILPNYFFFRHSFIDGNNYQYYTNFPIISCWIVALYYLFSFFYSVELAQRPVVVYERQHRNETKIFLESIFGKCFSHICLIFSIVATFNPFSSKWKRYWITRSNSLWIIIFELYARLHEVKIALCRDWGGSLRCWNQEIRESLPLRKKNN